MAKPSYEQLEAEVARLKKSKVELSAGHRGWRLFGVSLFALIGILGFVAADLGLWANRNIVSNDGYVRAISPLPHNPAVQSALVQAAHTQLVEQVDIPAAVSQVLPEQAAFLATPLSNAISNGVKTALAKVVDSDKFASVWVNVNQRAHNRLVGIVTKASGDGTITVNELYQYLGSQVTNSKLQSILSKPIPDKYGQIQIAQASWLPAAHDALQVIKWSVPIGILIGVIGLGAALAIARRRRLTLIVVSLALAASLLVAVLVVYIITNMQLDKVSDQTYQAAFRAVTQAFTGPLYSQTAAWVVFFGLLGVVAWAASTYKPARWLRSQSQGLSQETYQVLGSPGTKSSFIAWLRQWRAPIEMVLAGLALVALALMTPLTVGIIFWTAIILAIAVFIVEIFGGQPAKR